MRWEGECTRIFITIFGVSKEEKKDKRKRIKGGEREKNLSRCRILLEYIVY